MFTNDPVGCRHGEEPADLPTFEQSAKSPQCEWNTHDITTESRGAAGAKRGRRVAGPGSPGETHDSVVDEAGRDPQRRSYAGPRLRHRPDFQPTDNLRHRQAGAGDRRRTNPSHLSEISLAKPARAGSSRFSRGRTSG